MNKFQNKSLFNKVPRVEGLLKRNFSLSNLTWFKVGGKAEIYFIPKSRLYVFFYFICISDKLMS